MATAVALSALPLLEQCADGRESPGDKREWGILQVAEYDNRSRTLTGIEFKTVAGYELMAVPRDGDFHPIWVMLKPQHGALYKQMPEGDFALAGNQLAELVQRGGVTPIVEKALTAHLRPATQ